MVMETETKYTPNISERDIARLDAMGNPVARVLNQNIIEEIKIIMKSAEEGGVNYD